MKGTDPEVREALKEAPGAVAEMLKSLSHPGRVRVLTLLLEGERDLAALQEGAGLSKNALVNHLNLLMENRLVERVRRGGYSLTTDGRELITAAGIIYLDSEVRREAERDRTRRMYAAGLRGEALSEKTISNRAVYQPCWISYTGAMAGALKSLGVSCDTTDVGGYSGYAFLTNVIRGEFCPSGPTAFHGDVWAEIGKATQSLGQGIEGWSDEGSYPAEEGEPKPEEMGRAKRLFELVKREVDSERPAVLWGLFIPEYGIVNGYRGNSYLTSTFMSLVKPSALEPPVPYHDLKAPGCLSAYFFRGPVDVEREEADREVVERAARFASGEIPVNPRYVAGPEAYTEWVDVLENHPEQKSYHGNSYTAACVWEAKTMAAGFLRRLSERYSGARTKNLGRAQRGYAEAAELMRGLTETFPFSMEGEMAMPERRKGAEILRRVREIEEEAVGHLDEALKNW